MRKYWYALPQFKDISISKKLYFTVGIMAFLIVVELCVLKFAVTSLSAVRSYVSGEGLWSKAQKDAIYSLRLYAYSQNEKDYRDFEKFLKISVGDSKARMALEKAEPDIEAARQGFLEGRNHPDDIDGMIELTLRFESYLSPSFYYWKRAEASLFKLIPVSEKLHQAILSRQVTATQIQSTLNTIDKISVEVTPLEDGFSYTLGETSRWFEHLVLNLLLTLALTIETTGIIIAISISRRIQKGLSSIIEGAKLFASESFQSRVKVYSGDEIGTLATAFNEMADKLENTISNLKESENRMIKQKNKAEASEKIKQIFIANISHEIRTPMNAIIGFAHLINESDLNHEQSEYIKAILKSSEFLQVLLSNMLDLSKIEAGKVILDKKPINIEEIISTAVAMLDSEALKKNLSLSYSIDKNIPDAVYGDEVRLSQILLNLITNAIKYTPEGQVFVQAELKEETETLCWIEYSIQDTGIGIPEEKHAQIFENFEQLVHDRQFGGIGLGLSIVKQLVTLHGGSVFIKKDRKQGTDFRLLLPFNKVINSYLAQQQPLASAKPEEQPAQRDIKVLVADDNSLNQLLIKKLLIKKGFSVDIAGDGLVAVEKYEANNYDIILMDLDMPEMNGFEATKTIRKTKKANNKLPIIAITAHVTFEVKERCLNNGMNDFISKPFHPEELYQKIIKHVNKLGY